MGLSGTQQAGGESAALLMEADKTIFDQVA
jgi:hypothetical protein